MPDDLREDGRSPDIARRKTDDTPSAPLPTDRDLAAEREWLRITLASIGDAVVSTDADGRVVYLNRAAEGLTGWPQADAAGRPLPDVFRIINEYTREPAENPAVRALRDGVVVGLANHTLLVARDGTERPIADSAAPIRDASGTPVGAVLVFRDVTDQKRAEDALARLAAIVESSDDAIVSKTLDGVIRSWNVGAERLFGWAAGEAVGRPITIIIPPERLNEERDILARLRRGERVEHYETVRVAKDGRRLDISLTVSPLRDAEGRVVGASKVARDVTDRKRAERRLATQLAVTHALADSATLDEAAPKILAAVCERQNWEVGGLWRVDRGEGVLRCSTLWHSPSLPVPRFAARSRDMTFRPGVGLPGRVWASAACVWIPNITGEENFPRGPVAAEEGLRAGFGCPVVHNGELLGVVEFFSRDAREPDDELLRMMAGLGSQIGQFVEGKRAEAALRESEERQRKLADNLPSGFIYQITQSPDGVRRFSYVSRGVRAVCGVTPEEVLADPISLYGLILPEDAERLRAGEEEAYRHRREFDCRFRVRSGEKVVWLHCRSAPRFSADGGAVWDGIALDVTERVLAEEALRAAEERSEFVRCASGVGFWFCDLPFDVLQWDERVKAHFHLPPDAHVTIDTFYDRIHPDDRGPTRAAIERSNSERVPYDVHYRTVDPGTGAEKWVRAIGRTFFSPAGTPVRFDGVTLDVTEQKRAESALRESERRFREFADTAPAMLWVTDPGGSCTFLSRGWYEFTGQTEAEGLAFGWLTAVHPDDRARAGETFLAANARREPFALEHRLRWAGGGYRWVIDAGRPRFSPGGEHLGYVGSVLDVTDRKVAEEQARQAAGANAKFRTFFEQGTNFAGVLSLDGTVVEANRLCLDACGFTREEVIGRPFWECGWWSPAADLVAMVRRACGQAAEGRQFRAESRYFVASGEARFVDLVVAPVTDGDGRVLFLAATGSDITERRAMEDALRDADRRKDEFIALLAHELRNPLAPIRSGLEVIRLAGSGPESVVRARERMDRQLTHMIRLVDDLLDISRISRGKMELRLGRVRLADLVGSAVETARPLIDAAGHELTVELPDESVVLDADMTRLAQVFANLLTNSAKYTERGGRIWLIARREGGSVIVTVRDNGIGIPPEALPQVFDMFSQLDRSIEKTTGGLGIGLALVKGLTEMHGGTAVAASEGPGRGSTFTVTLPVADRVAALPSDENENSGRRLAPVGPDRVVLVVDDNRDGAESLAEMVRLLGHDVHAAHDGVEAVEAAERLRPDLILMDVGMPRLNGLDATRRIRERPWGSSVTIVALTGWGQENDRAKSREAGCDGHLIKPASLTDLEKLLADLPARR